MFNATNLSGARNRERQDRNEHRYNVRRRSRGDKGSPYCDKERYDQDAINTPDGSPNYQGGESIFAANRFYLCSQKIALELSLESPAPFNVVQLVMIRPGPNLLYSDSTGLKRNRLDRFACLRAGQIELLSACAESLGTCPVHQHRFLAMEHFLFA